MGPRAPVAAPPPGARATCPRPGGTWRSGISAYHPSRPSQRAPENEETVLIQHIKSIRTSGTILPSSSFLVRRLAGCVDFAHARHIVELGMGTGCVTRELLRRMRPDTRLISLEINPSFIEECRHSIRDARLTIVQACATTLPEVLEREGLDGADAVVSSLPLSLMPQDVVDRILDVARSSLRPGGRFVQYQYSLANHPRLTERYGDVAVGFTLLNVPPAFVYKCSQEGALGSGRRARTREPLAWAYAGVLAAVALAVRAYQQL